MPPLHRALLTAPLVAALSLSATAAPAADDAHKIDLVMSVDPVTLAPGDSGRQTITVTNRGSSAEGPVLVTYVTPAYTNIDRGMLLPSGCTIRYANPDPTVPEILTCEVPAERLAEDQTVSLGVPLALTTRARLTGFIGSRVSAVPAPGSTDQEADLGTNWMVGFVNITKPTPEVPQGNRVGLYLSHITAILDKDDKGTASLVYGNAGSNDVRGEVQLTAVSPFSTKFDRSVPLSDGCSFALEDPTPGIPEIVVCRRPSLAVGEEAQVDLPLTGLPGHPFGTLYSSALVAPAGDADVETDQTDNIDVVVVRAPVRSA